MEKPAFAKINYILMISGVVLLFLGYFVMTTDTERYGFGSAGITVGPLMILISFVIEFFAIMYRPKDQEE